MKNMFYAGCFALIVLGFIAGIYYLNTQIPDVLEQMPPNASPVIVTLTTPSNDTAIPLNDSTTITVDAVGPQAIVSLELWVNGARLFNKTSESGLKQLTATWAWLPQSEGAHTLIARAMDAQQHEGQSNVVHIIATKDANPTIQVTYKPQAGDTLPIIAQKFKTPPQQVIDANPEINPNNPIPADQDVSVPIPDSSESGPGVDNSTPEQAPSNPPPPPPNLGQDAPSGPPNKWIFGIKALANLLSKSNPPAKPGLAAVVDGCNVKLIIADSALNEDGFYVERAGPKPTLKPIATLDAHNGATPFLYTDSNLVQGQYVYHIVTFNPAGQSLSNPAQVKITDGKCKKQNDVIQLKDPILKIAQPVDKVYCYLKINNGDWQRIPHAPNTFLPPSKQGTFDVSAYLKSLPISSIKNKMTLELDCWGWKGNNLVYLGNAKETLGAGQFQMKASQFEFNGALPAIDLPTGGLPGITPSPEQFLGGGLASIVPPTGLANTDNPKTCTAHMPGVLAVLGGEFACQQAITSGNYAVLVWEWKGGCWPGDSNCVKTIDGYRVYREDFPAPTLVKEAKGEGLKTALFPLPPQPWPLGPNAPVLAKAKYAALSKNCYFVRAYKDGVGESPDSQKICLPWETLSQTKTLSPANVLTRGVWHEHTEYYVWDGPASICKQGLAGPQAGPNEIQVGFFHSVYGDCDGYYNRVSRGAVYFDLSSIPKNAFLNFAQLEYDFKQVGNVQIGGTATNERINCATRLMLGTEAWMGKDFGKKVYWIPGENHKNLESNITTVPNPLKVDVADAVKEWLQGTRPNDGFVFRSGTEGLDHQDNNRCDAIYSNFHLKLSYQTP